MVLINFMTHVVISNVYSYIVLSSIKQFSIGGCLGRHGQRFKHRKSVAHLKGIGPYKNDKS